MKITSRSGVNNTMYLNGSHLLLLRKQLKNFEISCE